LDFEENDRLKALLQRMAFRRKTVVSKLITAVKKMLANKIKLTRVAWGKAKDVGSGELDELGFV
jgi:hypothetical protein